MKEQNNQRKFLVVPLLVVPLLVWCFFFFLKQNLVFFERFFRRRAVLFFWFFSKNPCSSWNKPGFNEPFYFMKKGSSRRAKNGSKDGAFQNNYKKRKSALFVSEKKRFFFCGFSCSETHRRKKKLAVLFFEQEPAGSSSVCFFLFSLNKNHGFLWFVPRKRLFSNNFSFLETTMVRFWNCRAAALKKKNHKRSIGSSFGVLLLEMLFFSLLAPRTAVFCCFFRWKKEPLCCVFGARAAFPGTNHSSRKEPLLSGSCGSSFQSSSCPKETTPCVCLKKNRRTPLVLFFLKQTKKAMPLFVVI